MIPALLFLNSVQPFAMTSMGDVRNNIEFTRRLLDETRTAANFLAERKVRLRPGCSAHEHAALETRIDRLEQTEHQLRDELGRLMVVAFWTQVSKR